MELPRAQDIEKIVWRLGGSPFFIFQVINAGEELSEREIAGRIKDKFPQDKKAKRLIDTVKLSQSLRDLTQAGLLTHNGMDPSRHYQTFFSRSDRANLILEDEELRGWLVSPIRNRFLIVLDKVRIWATDPQYKTVLKDNLTNGL